MHFSVGSVSRLCGSRRLRAPGALRERHGRKYKTIRNLASCTSVMSFSRVGRDAANEVDGCPCLCVEFFFVRSC